MNEKVIWDWISWDHVEFAAPDIPNVVLRIVNAYRSGTELIVVVGWSPDIPQPGYFQIELVPRPNNLGIERERYFVALTGFKFPSHDITELVMEVKEYV